MRQEWIVVPTAADFAEARAQYLQLSQAKRCVWADEFGSALEGTIKMGFLRQGLHPLGDEAEGELRALVHYVASIASRATVMACERKRCERLSADRAEIRDELSMGN